MDIVKESHNSEQVNVNKTLFFTHKINLLLLNTSKKTLYIIYKKREKLKLPLLLRNNEHIKYYTDKKSFTVNSHVYKKIRTTAYIYTAHITSFYLNLKKRIPRKNAIYLRRSASLGILGNTC